jgi:cytidylate kinase
MIITIGGKSGSGKSSVSKAIAAKIGYKFFSTGDFFREQAAKRGLSVLEYDKLAASKKEFDLQADEVQRKLGQAEKNLVVESRLGFHFIPNSIKIFLTANDEVRAKRTMEPGRSQENHRTLDEAWKKLAERDECDRGRYVKLYGVDPFNEDNYDFVLDTSGNTVEQSAKVVLDFVMKRMKKQK